MSAGRRLILASASPRRRAILEALGIGFEVVAPEAEELHEGASPEQLVLENARRKAWSGLARSGPGSPPTVLAADTEVVLDGRLLGKAEWPEEARERLVALSGRTHDVLGGLVLLDPAPGGAGPGDVGADEAGEASERAGVARSRVTFRELDDATIELYLDSGEWRDRAGAYAVQGLGSVLVDRLEGDLSNVIGLPVRLLLALAPDLLRDPEAMV